MLFLILLATCVMLLNILVQMGALSYSTSYLVKKHRSGQLGVTYLHDAMCMGMISVMLLVGHLVQIAFWAIAFMMCGEFEKFREAFYHSAVNFASLGYGDIVMSEKWRLLGALQASVGVMMFGISAALLFAIISELLKTRFRDKGGNGAG